MEEDVIIAASVADNVIATATTSIAVSVDQPIYEKTNSGVQVSEHGTETIMSIIPGLESAISSDEDEETLDVSHNSTAEYQLTSQELDMSLISALPLDVSSSDVMTYTSDTLSPSVAVSDTSPVPSNNLVVSTQYFLPKMVVPDVNLNDDQKDNLQKLAFIRILEAYKQVSLSGGSQVHLTLLAHLGIEVVTLNQNASLSSSFHFFLQLSAWLLM